MKMQMRSEVISPSVAADMLRGNRGNRMVRRAAVKMMAEEMREGRWLLTHQGIAIAPCGRLLDGQHRLLAVVEANVPVEMMVARNVPADTFLVLDGAGPTGGKRSLRDVTGIDPRILETCSYVARLHNVDRPTALHIQSMMESVGDAVLELLAAAGHTAKGRTAAPIKAAAALRLIQGHRVHVLQQWRAFVNLRYDEMTSSVQALTRQLTDARKNSLQGRGGGTVQNDRAVRAWMAFDPRRASASKIQVSDVDGQLAEMRSVWTPPWKAR